MNEIQHNDVKDLVIIGGGINGCGIARDAAGRGLTVSLFEMGDLAQATSSGSTKLFHGGLRYLEYYEFRLVREALIERERLLKAMPHISWPLRFVLPHHKGLRPSWLLRVGLFIYDHLGGRKILPATKTLNFAEDKTGIPLKKSLKKGFEYSDCWVDDARLVVLNARDAEDRGAKIHTRTRVESAERVDGLWRVTVRDLITNEEMKVQAKTVINCAGPWVADVLNNSLHLNSKHGVRLVRGSHIVVKKLYDHDRAYIFQQSDNRIIFAIPYEDDFTLIGTTDVDHEGPAEKAYCTPEEQEYLLKAASEYFEKPLKDSDVVWTYSGVRPLYDDNASSATEATRDYVLKVDSVNGRAAALNVFGGKITTYRKLAESALREIEKFHPQMGRAWTAGIPLPGGDYELTDSDNLLSKIQMKYPFLDNRWAKRMLRTYGTDTFNILGKTTNIEELGQHFGYNLYELEVNWLQDNEWAKTVEDILWRRTKLGLRIDTENKAKLNAYLAADGV
ncbi:MULTISPECIES: glycerol-3-phosphate dehydrogenase [unclassified Marinobacterium]|uniref:glycerol-3-phosphate dehydrogenase n=1 Tax=unclassified Marinobacterium TaxID=2644139 RepID=UPI0015684F1D|nr:MULTISPECIES: glycerol-3-phosphate dehydrogenase [unclassified Marinobacterium]NRP37191.1 Aerobic glycerol-3-phosphate dehydrogenase [Marinobacterium sp. xm-d-579]NRP59666.1 Aerobic glycerol-3-phosphate dehydrogenase [Marinobacterium sp. xm-d-564]